MDLLFTCHFSLYFLDQNQAKLTNLTAYELPASSDGFLLVVLLFFQECGDAVLEAAAGAFNGHGLL